jgi:lipoprotein NlpI
MPLPLTGLLLITLTTMTLADEPTDSSLAAARAALANRKYADAARLAEKAVRDAPQDVGARTVLAQAYDGLRDYPKALAIVNDLLRTAPPDEAGPLLLRGMIYFKMGKVAESVADFEKYAEREPRARPELWQLGIAYYYAGRYADGAKQFQLHKSVNPNDVENAAWHFLCTARAEGLEKARASFMPIDVTADRRVPMAQIYDLFGGKAIPPDVVHAALPPANARLTAAEAVRRRFYANLYIGLYYEAVGDKEKSQEYMTKAAEDAPQVGDYMAAVALVHAGLRKAGAKPK